MDELKSFIEQINSAAALDTTQSVDPKNNLKEIITRELGLNEVYSKLVASKQDRIKVTEVKMESEIDFISSARQLKAVFDQQLASAIQRVNNLYESELLNVQSLYRQEFFGAPLMNLIKKLNENEYSLVIMNSRIYAYKYYDPPFEVTRGQYESGVLHEYNEPVCKLKGVYVNLLHPKITNGTVLISTDHRHPNSKDKGLSEACVGNTDGRKIPIDDPVALVALLDEICAMYEVMHLDSAYFVPETSYTTKEAHLKWTA